MPDIIPRVASTGLKTLWFISSLSQWVIDKRQSAPSFSAFSIGPDKYAIIKEVEFYFCKAF
jgi:hypothetical protein